MSRSKNIVRVWDRTGKAALLGKACGRILRKSMEEMSLQEHEVNLTLITDVAMKSLNHMYRKKNASTDVLSFNQNVTLPSGILLLGDIMIATPTARRQAQAAGHSNVTEFGTLSIHGLLHLLGLDHQNEKDAKRMFALQNNLCRKTGVYA